GQAARPRPPRQPRPRRRNSAARAVEEPGETRDEHGSAPAASFTARLLISCPDRPGIVAAVSGFLFAREANIVSSHQYSSDPVGGRFFLRTEFFLPGDAAGAAGRESLERS